MAPSFLVVHMKRKDCLFIVFFKLSFIPFAKDDITSLAKGINERLTMLLSTSISELDLDLHRNSERKCLL